jgi:transcriptional regulator with XRE-family HTH domain
MALALRAGISARHLSFVETGRSVPSREVVHQLAEVLGIPLRERNQLLEAAGYARAYFTTSLDDPAMRQVRKALEFILRQHEPYGAVAVDRCWNIVLANEAHRRSVARLLAGRSVPQRVADNLLRLTFHPDGLRPCIANWNEVGPALLRRVQRELGGRPRDEELAALLEEVETYPGIPEKWMHPTFGPAPGLVLPVRLRAGEIDLRFFGTVTTLGTPQDVTLEEIRIEAFFPADPETEAIVRGSWPGPEGA